MCKIILEMVSKGCVHWSDLHKKVLGSCHTIAIHAMFASQLRYQGEQGRLSDNRNWKKYLEIIII
jgi:hypothetical protein